MKTIIAGSRDITEYSAVLLAIEYAKKHANIEITQIVSGGANGVDALGEQYARENSIPLIVMRADWKNHGKAAGPIRNKQMAECSDALIAIWDGASKGTKNMISEATKLGLRVYVHRCCNYCINCKPCECECHSEDSGMMHIIDCCYACPKCGRMNISANWNH